MVFLSSDVGNVNIDNILFQFETNEAGNGYVGPTAAKDDRWVTSIFETLKRNWPNPESSSIDNF
jgi:hypothetical protein